MSLLKRERLHLRPQRLALTLKGAYLLSSTQWSPWFTLTEAFSVIEKGVLFFFFSLLRNENSGF